MDTSQEYQQVLKKIQGNKALSYRDIAVAVANDPDTLLKYLSDNDPIQCYRLLHQSDSAMVIGQNANFTPDKARVDGEFKLLLIKKDYNTLNQVVSNFVVNPSAQNWTTNQNVIKNLQDIGVLMAVNNGYALTTRFNG